MAQILRSKYNYESKIKTPEEMLAVRMGILNATFVTTNGCFDLIHPGHVEFLTEAAILGSYLIVLVNTDESVSKLKIGRPCNPLDDRMLVLAALAVVDFIVPFSELTPCKILEYLRPDIHVKGSEYKHKPMPETEVVESYGGEIRFINFLSGYSTTRIIRRILKGEEMREEEMRGEEVRGEKMERGEIGNERIKQSAIESWRRYCI